MISCSLDSLCPDDQNRLPCNRLAPFANWQWNYQRCTQYPRKDVLNLDEIRQGEMVKPRYEILVTKIITICQSSPPSGLRWRWMSDPVGQEYNTELWYVPAEADDHKQGCCCGLVQDHWPHHVYSLWLVVLSYCSMTTKRAWSLYKWLWTVLSSEFV